MHPRTFLRITLALPLLVPVVAFYSASTSGIAFVLMMSMVFGGGPYLLTSIILWLCLGKCQSQRSFIGTVISAPLLFAPLQALTWFFAGDLIFPNTTADYYGSLVLGGYGLALGYCYVLLVLAAFALAIYFKLVTSPQTMTKEPPKRA